MVVMPGGGIRPHNILEVVAVPGVTEVHLGVTRTRASGMNYHRAGVHMGSAYEPDEYVVQVADIDMITFMKSTMAETSGG
jgi:copper homeostasis protein CutC